MELTLNELQVGQPRRTLIAVDLGDSSEKIISYIFLLTRDILSEYTIFHCLKGTSTEKEAHDEIHRILETPRSHLQEKIQSTINIYIVSGDLVEELKRIHAEKNFGTVVMGTTNRVGSWEMGHTAQAILRNGPAGVIAVPPATNLIFPSSVSILVEKLERSCLSLFSTFQEFVEHYGIFLNFVLFARDKQTLDEERKLIAEYQEYFDSTITFSFIVEQEQTYMNFLKYIDGINCESAVVAWNKNSTAFKSAGENGIIYCSAKIPILYIKSDAVVGEDAHLVFTDNE